MHKNLIPDVYLKKNGMEYYRFPTHGNLLPGELKSIALREKNNIKRSHPSFKFKYFIKKTKMGEYLYVNSTYRNMGDLPIGDKK